MICRGARTFDLLLNLIFKSIQNVVPFSFQILITGVKSLLNVIDHLLPSFIVTTAIIPIEYNFLAPPQDIPLSVVLLDYRKTKPYYFIFSQPFSC